MEIEGYRLPPERLAALLARDERWAGVAAGLHGAVGSVDRRYDRHLPPDSSPRREFAATAWRGERVHGQFLLWTRQGVNQVRFDVPP